MGFLGIVISTQHRLAKLQAQSMAAKNAADESKSVSEITFVSMAENGTLDDVTAMEHINVFEKWHPNTSVKIGSLRSYDEKLYRCLQAHTTQEGWEPDKTPSLWKEVGDPTIEYPAWSRPIGSTDTYQLNAKVSHNGKNWVSDVDNNVWEPGVYGWTEVTE